jgi:hypothetical protein
MAMSVSMSGVEFDDTIEKGWRIIPGRPVRLWAGYPSTFCLILYAFKKLNNVILIG